MGLESRINIEAGYTFGAFVRPTASNAFGESGAPSGLITFSDGTGAGQANQVFEAALSITAGSTATYDLKGGGGELDVLNVALAMTAVKLVYLQLDTPAASTSLQFGPQGVSDAAQLWFQAATTNFWEQVYAGMFHWDARAGWALDATHKVIAIKNPGAATVTAKLWVFGTK